MKFKVRYILFLLAGVFYLLKNLWHYSPYWINVLNDLLALPVILMVMEFLMQQIYGHRFKMTGLHIFFTVAVISILSEGIFPLLYSHLTPDPVDVLLYFFGGMLYYFWPLMAQISLMKKNKIRNSSVESV